MTTRRDCLLAMAALSVPMAARAQGLPGVRIGWISHVDPGPSLPAFREAMRALGYVGRNELNVELRIVPQRDGVAAAVEALRALPVTLMVAMGPPAPLVHRALAGRLPMVFAVSGDPVVSGMVESLSHPGGSTTGVSFLALELVGKRLEVLREIVPEMRRVAILANPNHAGEKSELNASLAAAGRWGIATSYVSLPSGEPTEPAFERIRSERVGGIIVFPDADMIARAKSIAQFAIEQRVPTISGWGEFARAGFVSSYGPKLIECYRRLAVYVDRVLHGARPESMPVELPTHVELVLNQRAAREVGVGLPRALLARADEVID